MSGINNSMRVFLATRPVDLRQGFNGLFVIVQDRLKKDPCSGALVFTNGRRIQIKVLYWDGTGMWVAIKRLAPSLREKIL